MAATNEQLKQMQELISLMREVNRQVNDGVEGAKYLDRQLGSLGASFAKSIKTGGSGGSLKEFEKLSRLVENFREKITRPSGTSAKETQDVADKLNYSVEYFRLLAEILQLERQSVNTEKEKTRAKQETNRASRASKESAKNEAKTDSDLGNKEESDRLEKLKRQQELFTKESRQRAAELRKLFGDDVYGKLMSKAGARGFNFDQISRIKQDMASGLTDVTFRDFSSIPGVVKEATATIDAAGNVSDKVAKRFQGLAAGVRRNILEFSRWTIAVALILGPLRKMQELSQEVVEQQDKLVNITIAMGNAQKEATQIYSEALDVAQKVSTEVGDVLDAYTLAYRATGGMANETERFATATKLLEDAMTLSKLSGMEEAEAIDTLTASLKQSDMALNDGVTLLDKWIKATKIANIDLTSLATSFAIVGDVSAKAGMDTNSLIGLIAALGETGVASGRELANMGKAIVSGFQSDTGSKALQNLGISLNKMNGEAREFMDVMDQVAGMQQRGLLTKSQYSELTLALGGGVRRQAVWSTLIENWSRVREVASNLDDSSGMAADALSKKYETAASAITRLANALSSLSMSVANEGGLLEIFTSLTNTFSKLIGWFDKLSSLAGKMTPILLAFGVLNALGKDTKLNIASRVQSAFAGAVSGTYGRAAERMTGNRTVLQYTSNGYVGIPYKDYMGTRAQESFFRNRPGINTSYANIAGAAAMTAGMALWQATDKNATPLQRQSRTVGSLAGGTLGGVLGTVIGGPTGTMIGTTLGMSIANAFVEATIARETDFVNFFKNIQTQPEFPEKEDKFGETTAERQKRLEAQAKLETTGVAAPWLQEMTTSIWTWFANMELKSDVRKQAKDSGMSFQEFIKEAYGGEIPKYDPLSYMRKFGNLSEETERGLLEEERTSNRDEYIQNLILDSQKGFNDQYADLLKDMVSEYKIQLLGELGTGTITNAQYAAGDEALRNLNMTVSSAYVQVGKELEKYQNASTEAIIEGFAKINIYSTDEQKGALTDVISDYTELSEKLKDQNITAEERSQLEAEQIALLGALNLLYEELIGNVAEQVKILSISEFPDATKETFGALTPVAEELQRRAYKATFPAEKQTEEDYQAWAKAQDEWSAQLKGFEYQKMQGVLPEFYNQAIDKAKEEGTWVDESKGLDFRVMKDTSLSQLNQMFAAGGAYDQMLAKLTNAGYVENKEPTAVVLADETVHVFNKDWKIVEYLLSQILDVEEKQLETNLYNFPSGMTAYVPWGAVNTTLQKDSGGGGYSKDISDIINDTALEKETAVDLFDGVKTTFPSKSDSSIPTPLEWRVEQALKAKEESKSIREKIYDSGKQFHTGGRDIVTKEPVQSPANLSNGGMASYEFGKQIGDKIIEAFRRLFGIDKPDIPSTKPASGRLGETSASHQPTGNQLQNVNGTGLIDLFRTLLSTWQGGGAQAAAKPQSMEVDNTKSIVDTKLNIDIKAQTVVTMDSAIIAQAVSRAVASQMVRMGNAGSASVRVNVI